MSERNLDFDAVIDRRGTKCLKYDFAVQRGRPADVLPLWVADMDFKTSSYIEDALIRQAQHAIYGYTESDDAYFDAVQDALIAGYEQNQDFFALLLDNDEKKRELMQVFLEDVYRNLRT